MTAMARIEAQETGTAPAAPAPARRPDVLSGGGRVYETSVMHLRLSPRRHQFRYRVWTMLLDVDRIEETLAPLRWTGTGRFAPVAHRNADHGPRDGSALRPWAEAQLARVGVPAPAHIGLLALPRIFGRAFNPLSLHYCWDEAARLTAVIAEVKNTFGDQHAYVLTAETPGAKVLRTARDKHFFVSPFMDMDQRYRFDLPEPSETLRILIRQGAPGGPDRLIAAQTGTALPLGDATLRRLALRTPLHGLKAPLAIHWEALRLALKGVPFLGHPGDDAVFAPGARNPGG
ncbi:DUF1365 domain-containing protein [Rhodovulum sp. DZ06]|uniref:DUF1365 domain-containing protein n=1 Tax=Rhodovulum sp. DZ06 TaxID=3425126 RepID=UPI003D343A8F